MDSNAYTIIAHLFAFKIRDLSQFQSLSDLIALSLHLTAYQENNITT